ncbi:MAG: hypothetical protein UT02_C0044G0002 [Parcubacteria group bacterium GW2011_GWC2_38_7]|nr:MAG: hypothetical protein UT02_C0044G0002 [Parcubacteria group bacterium GW2011_GWC2_38_7]
MKKTLIVIPMLLLVVSLLVSSISFVQPAFAGQALQDKLTEPLEDVGAAAGYEATTPDLPATIGRAIGIILGFLGMILVLIVIYAGYLWMTAGGDPDKVKEAKAWMLNAVIGLIIVVAAYTISGFVIDQIFKAVSGTT